MRWPQYAVGLVSRAGALSPSKTYKLMRALHTHALSPLHSVRVDLPRAIARSHRDRSNIHHPSDLPFRGGDAAIAHVDEQLAEHSPFHLIRNLSWRTRLGAVSGAAKRGARRETLALVICDRRVGKSINPRFLCRLRFGSVLRSLLPALLVLSFAVRAPFARRGAAANPFYWGLEASEAKSTAEASETEGA